MRQTLLLAALLAAAPAAAATLRPSTTLSAPVVRLSDLFDDAGPRAAVVLGPAPGPGQRIVVEAAQLAAIARQFGVDWRPASASDRVVLDQPGRPLPRTAVVGAALAALHAAGAPAQADLDLPSFVPPMIPLLARPDVTVEQLDYDGASGHFAATLRIDGAGMSPLRLGLDGRVEPVVQVVALVRAVPSGTLLRSEDVALVRVRAAFLRGPALDSVAQAVGQTVRRPVPAGEPLYEGDVARPNAVAKGTRVTLDLRAPGLQLTAQGVALESGAAGARIAVLNPVSHMIVQGVIDAQGRVTVDSDAQPLPADAKVAAR